MSDTMCEIHGDCNEAKCPVCEHNFIYQICEDHGEYSGARCARCRAESFREDEYREEYLERKYSKGGLT